mmetsp:Transcript_30076/g.63437  ORF Transcript_30076/g.63437 Transcript_30076/m.63437 type:complete len:106 (+) Transcript_30076:264-581(+)
MTSDRHRKLPEKTTREKNNERPTVPNHHSEVCVQHCRANVSKRLPIFDHRVSYYKYPPSSSLPYEIKINKMCQTKEMKWEVEGEGRSVQSVPERGLVDGKDKEER